jgi:hypothetical protein
MMALFGDGKHEGGTQGMSVIKRNRRYLTFYNILVLIGGSLVVGLNPTGIPVRSFC